MWPSAALLSGMEEFLALQLDTILCPFVRLVTGLRQALHAQFCLSVKALIFVIDDLGKAIEVIMSDYW